MTTDEPSNMRDDAQASSTIFRSLLKKGRSCYLPALLLALIHQSAWKENSAKSAGGCEVGQPISQCVASSVLRAKR